MDDRIWTTVAFTALTAGAYEAVYLEENGTLTRMPILGVLIDEEVVLIGPNDVVRTGTTRAGMAHQTHAGAADLEIAGGSIGFLGVYPTGAEPLSEYVDRARARLSQLPPANEESER